MVSPSASRSQGFLEGIRVIELADELGEYCGKVLAGLGADVIKVEPPGGGPTRRYGPFYEDEPHPNRSLYFWHYNFGKRGITLDLDSPEQRQQFRELVSRSDILLETMPKGYMSRLGLDYDSLREHNPSLVYCRITPFGDDGPWSDYKTSDLVHLALGGVMMNNGYDADPTGFYETPPIAPQTWQAYHIGGEMAAIATLGALLYRKSGGTGQMLSTAIHQAVAQQTEVDLPSWIYSKKAHYRQTCRHSAPVRGSAWISLTKDGRWVMPHMTQAGPGGPLGTFKRAVEFLDSYGMADDLDEPAYEDDEFRRQKDSHIVDVLSRFVGKFMYKRDIWRDAQDRMLVWAPERNPEENLDDAHWSHRETFMTVGHPELGKTFTYVGAKWMCPQVGWRAGPRAPLVGEHNGEVLRTIGDEPPRTNVSVEAAVSPRVSKHGKQFALSGVRMIDLSWLLASGGAGRFLSSLGAEVIRVEHRSRLDFLRLNSTAVEGGFAERSGIDGPITLPRGESVNRSGFFNEINSGRRGVSLNIQTRKGKEILARLLKDAHVIAEGFSPGTMDRLGFGWKELQEINPRLVYVQQSGMGQIGTYGRSRSYGPIAAAFSGLSEMSGFPAPFPPAGIGYSYLDWFGAYNMALAIMAGLNYQQRTGQGVWIDSSQVESGTYLVGTAILDYSANGRQWQRIGNQSPYKCAAPHGAYRCDGDDRWIAIACFNDAEWQALGRVLGDPQWTREERFSTLEGRFANRAELDVLVEGATRDWDRYALQAALQAAGVPAGACQDAQDRVEADPQLRHLKWLTDLRHSETGVWPIKEFPVSFSETPPYMGGYIDRNGPCYGEDNEYVYCEMLGMSTNELRELEAEGVI